MIKRMVMTDTYRQSSTASESTRQRDPGNRWLSRQNRYRLDAELIRDGTFTCSALLSGEIGGPSVKPYQPAGYWTFLNFPKRDYVTDKERTSTGAACTRTGSAVPASQPARLRRFDMWECVVQRSRTRRSRPSSFFERPSYVEAARGFAARVIREGAARPQGSARSGVRLLPFASRPTRRGIGPRQPADQALQSICPQPAAARRTIAQRVSRQSPPTTRRSWRPGHLWLACS